MGMYIVCGTVY